MKGNPLLHSQSTQSDESCQGENIQMGTIKEGLIAFFAPSRIGPQIASTKTESADRVDEAYRLQIEKEKSQMAMNDKWRGKLIGQVIEDMKHDIKTIHNKEMIDHPEHYSPGPFEVIKIIVHYKLCFRLGNTIKYILRSGKKDPTKYLEDLKKARWYLDHYIQEEESKWQSTQESNTKST